MISITHIINPVRVKENSDLFKAQPVTFESMKRAKDFALDKVKVNLLTTQYMEDRKIIPEHFTITPNIERSVLDVGAFKHKRKLPLLIDILKRAVDYDPKADYIIYSNVDIALMPYFYLFVEQKIQQGLDAFVINRRTIPDYYDIDTLDLAYSEIGEKHPGFDCFIFKVSMLENFVLEKICIGTTRIGLAFIANLIIYSNKFKIFSDEHLTFHIGEDRVWQSEAFNDYVDHNESEAFKILSLFKEQHFKKFECHDMLIKYFENLKTIQESKKKSFRKKFIDKLK